MDNSTSQPFRPHAEHFDAVTSPSYHDSALYTAVPDTKEEWEGLLRNNTSCLKGIAFSQQTGLPEMAQYTAFEFHYDPLKGPEHVQGEETDFKVLKIESDFQQQGVHIGVSQQDIEVLMKNLALENRLDFQNHKKSHHQKKRTAKIKKLEISHRHPKFVLFLDQRSLAITADCQERLQRLRNTHDKGEIIAFLEDYGEGFATQVTVGGRLFHSENVSMLEDDALEERINSLRAAAKASLPSIKSFAKTCSVSYEAGMVHTEHSQSKSVSEGVIWCGVGGDPCLHGDPGAWMLSMKEDKSRWKIIEKRRVKTLPVILGKFNGFEWVPQKFQELLKPALQSVPRLALTNDFHIGLPSLAISSAWSAADDEGRETLLSGFVFLQDEMGFIKYGYIRMKVSDMKPDILFVDSTVRARYNSPLYIGESLSSISILNVTEEGFLADLILDDTGGLDYGSLVDLQLQVAPHSNIACTSDPGQYYICFEDLNGNLCLVSIENGVEYMDHGQDLNILPGTALAICSWKSYTGSMGWRSTYHHLAIGFQDQNGRLMSLERQTSETYATQWNLSEIVAPSVLEGFTFKPWTRSNCLFSLRPISPPQIEYAFYPDSSNRLIYHACDKSGRLVKHSNPICTIWGNSRYTYVDQALVYMSANGQLECTSLCENPELCKNRAIFQPHCRKRYQAQLRWTL